MKDLKSWFKNFQKEGDSDADPQGVSTKTISNVPLIIVLTIIILFIFGVIYAAANRTSKNGASAENTETSKGAKSSEQDNQDLMAYLQNKSGQYPHKAPATNVVNTPKAKEDEGTVATNILLPPTQRPILNEKFEKKELSEFERKRLEMEQQMQLKAFTSKISLGGNEDKNNVNNEIHASNTTPSVINAGFNAQQDGKLDKDDFDAKADKFLNKPKPSGYLEYSKAKPISKFEIKAGWVIPATLITGINSELPGQILAMITQNVYDTAKGIYLLIPQGTKAVGVYSSNIIYGQERLLVAWNKLIFPDGSSLNLGNMQGTSMDGLSGFTDQVNNHYFKIFGSALLLSSITAGISLADGDGNGSDKETAKDKAIAQAIEQMGQVASRMIQKNMDIAPTLEIRPGYKFNIFVNKDIILEPLKVNR